MAAQAPTLSLENRVRVVADEDGPGDRLALVNRLRLSADTGPHPLLRARLTLGCHLTTSPRFAPPVIQNQLDIAEAVLNLSPTPGMTFAVGRQEWNDGSGRIISRRDLPNVRRAFDGLRLRVGGDATQVDLLWGHLVENRPGVFDDRPAPGEHLGGVYARLGDLDLYWLHREAPDVRYAAAAGPERRSSLGVRWAGESGGWRWDWEALVQWGKTGDLSIRAWTVATDQSFGGSNWPAGLRIGARANVASGDRNLVDGRLGTFNALYPRLSYFSEAAVLAPANIMNVQPFLEARPDPSLSLRADADVAWRHRTSDAIYLAPFRPVLPVGDSRHIGTSFEIVADWQIGPALALRASATRFAPGSALRAAGLSPQTLVAAQVEFQFAE